MLKKGGHITQRTSLFGFLLLPVLSLSVLASPTAQAQTTDGKAIWDGKYDDLLAAARKEGEVVLALGGAASRNLRPVVEVFAKKFGIKPVLSLGSGNKQVARVLAEQRAGTWAVDVVMAGANSGIRLVKGKRLAEIKPLLFLSEVVDQSRWYQGRHWYGDYPDGRYIFTYAAEGTPPYINLVYNTKLVNVGEINSVWDILDPKWKGKIVSTPPDMTGQGETWPMAYVHPDMGPKWVERFITGMNVFFTEDTRVAMDGVAHGRWAIGTFMGSITDAQAMAKDGLPIATLEDTGKPLKEAQVLRGSGAVSNLMVPRIQPHPNATKVFLNWYLSREGQETVAKLASTGAPTPSLREDIKDWGSIPQIKLRTPGVKYLFVTHDPAFLKNRPEAEAFLAKMYRQATGQK